MRTEHDALGSAEIPEGAYYGIATKRAAENFQLSGRTVHPEIIRAMVTVKKAAALANLDAKQISGEVCHAITSACDDVLTGNYNEMFIVDALAGGAGTSVNMNVNEVLANVALRFSGRQPGDYHAIHPLDHVNMSQSTNDVFPTAIRIAGIRLLLPLAETLADLQTALQNKEAEFAAVVKVGRTQLQDAVPVTLGQEFGAWAQAIARDRWRLYKAEERLRQINLGGTAVGTGLNADIRYTFAVTERLRQLTGLGLARAEYLMDPTQNADVFSEVSGLLKTAAVNLMKICNDLRLLASGPYAGFAEITLPERQAGSSIMPGKVNPVIPEAVNQIAMQVIGMDSVITMAAMQGQLELNAFLPLIADNLMQMLDLLTRGVRMLIDKCIDGISANPERIHQHLQASLVQATALVGQLGYDQVAMISKSAQSRGITLKQSAMESGLISELDYDRLTKPFDMTTPGIPGRKRGILR